MISVVIPSFRNPEVLDLCLKSLVEGQQNKNQIIIVIDGDYEISKDVLEKHAESVDILALEQNVGTCRATNLGVFNATYDQILIINDDNVAPKDWDVKLEKKYQPGFVFAPNQIEPYPSIFPQFDIKDLGRDPKTFNLNAFWEYETLTSTDKVEFNGSTFPIFIDKFDFLKVGGFGEDYPSPSGFVADCEFFMKCQMNGLQMVRTYNCHFYHFVSVSTKTPEKIEQSRQYEANCHQYFRYKWGEYMKRDNNNNVYFK